MEIHAYREGIELFGSHSLCLCASVLKYQNKRNSRTAEFRMNNAIANRKPLPFYTSTRLESQISPLLHFYTAKIANLSIARRPARTCGRAVPMAWPSRHYARLRRSARPARPTSINMAPVGSGTLIVCQLAAFFEFANCEPNAIVVSSEASTSTVAMFDT